MKTVLICNQKGGVGKSLIADELAFSFDRTALPYSFFDLDGQHGVIHETKEDSHAEVTIIDTPGTLQPELKQWMENADLIIIPTRLTGRDIGPLQTMMSLAKAHATCPVLYVLNGFQQRFLASKSFREWFDAQGDLDSLILPQSEYYAQAAGYGCSVLDVVSRTSYVGMTTLAFINSVRRRLQLPQEVV